MNIDQRPRFNNLKKIGSDIYDPLIIRYFPAKTPFFVILAPFQPCNEAVRGTQGDPVPMKCPLGMYMGVGWARDL